MKWLGRTLKAFVLVILLIVGVYSWGIHTETGTQNLWRIAQSFTPASKLGTIQGSLAGPFEIHDLQVNNAAMHISIDHAKINWRLYRLFKGQLQVDQLEALGVRYQAIPTKPKAKTPLTLSSLAPPIEITLADVTLEQLSLISTPSAEPFVIDKLHLSANIDSDALTLRPLSMSSALLDLNAATAIRLSGENQTTGELSWTLRLPDLSPLTGTATIDGDLNKLLIQSEVAAPYALDAELSVINVLNAPQATFSLQPKGLALSEIKTDYPDISISGSITGQHFASDRSTQIQSTLQLDNVPQAGSLSLLFKGLVNDDRVTINSLLVNQTNGELQLSSDGSVTLGATPEANLAVNWQQLQWPLNNTPALVSPRGELRISGPLKQPTIHIGSAISQPLVTDDLSITAELDLSGTQPIVSLKSTIPEFYYPAFGEPQLSDAAAILTLSGTLPLLDSEIVITVGNDADKPTFSAASQFDLTEASNPLFELNGTWNHLSWPLVDEVKLVASDHGAFSAHGSLESLTAKIAAAVNTAGQLKANLNYTPSKSTVIADWSNLSFDSLKTPLASARGNLRIDGAPDAYDLTVDTDLQSQDKNLLMRAAGQGSLSALNLSKINVELLEGTIHGTAEVMWKPEVKTTTNLTATGLNPGLWWQDWPGQIDTQLSGAMQFTNGQFDISKLTASSSGQLRDYPINLTVAGAKRGNTIRIDDLAVNSGDTRLKASGSIDQELDFSWEVASNDLRSLHPDANGTFSSSGSLQGTSKQPQFTATLNGKELSYKNNTINTIKLEADVDTSDHKQSTISADLEGQFGSINIERTELALNGLLSDHNLELNSKTSLGSIDASLHGALTDLSSWKFNLDQLEIKNSQIGDWGLLKPSQGSVSKGNGGLSSTCLINDNSQVCIEGQRDGQNMEAATSISNLSLAALLDPFQPTMAIEGVLNGDGHISWDGRSDPTGDFLLTNSNGQLSLKSTKDTEQQTLLVFEPGTTKIDLNGGRVAANFNLPLAGADRISGQATIVGQSNDWMQRDLQAAIDLNINDVAFLQHLAPEIDRLSGSVTGAMTIDGSLAKPVFNGGFQLNQGSFGLVGPEVLFDDINVNLRGDPLQGMNIDASANSGGGQVNISGVINITQPSPSANIILKGDNVQIMNTAQAKIYASPDVKLSLLERTIRLDGDIIIPRAEITIKEAPPSAINVSEDQIFINSGVPDESSKKPFQISAKVRTKLGDNVNFSGFGLKGRLEGELVSTEQPGKPAQINGEIKVIDGKYIAYGQKLNIETGRLLFSGAPGINPEIDLKATRQPTKDVRVGVTARGQIQHPEFTLYSSPAMTERNKLSYLLLGRAADQASRGEKSQLGQIALAFGLGKAEGFTGSIKDQLGIDDIGVETEPGTDAEQESFVLGKYLTPNLYLRYGIGLFEPINTLRLQYSINEHWRVVTESSGKSSGGDIYYSIDRGK